MRKGNRVKLTSALKSQSNAVAWPVVSRRYRESTRNSRKSSAHDMPDSGGRKEGQESRGGQGWFVSKESVEVKIKVVKKSPLDSSSILEVSKYQGMDLRCRPLEQGHRMNIHQ